ncbi:cytochrome c oxidase subunit 2 [Paenibacillus phyllosphaerae]|uniref:Cytochrome c oxidase subunit 2 n=1 Tax=Paenibacillus phyllosphaerae TaxID=274593 RepID=A0A7W5B4M3_9BACL|nr:cupredoxin domain-containing protein [Paenibacillus phyllosphaerae]MBB3114345.1 cytochrome c oxidase subunit 2 [Paenibacillus phyllosphaerae]
MLKKTWLVLAMAAFVLVLAACGAKNENEAAQSAGVEEPTTASREVVITASNWEFDQAEYKIKKGESVKLTVEAKSGIHGIEFKNLDVNDIRSGDSEVITINEPGTYEFYCNIMCGTGHSKMVSKLVVE